MHGVGSLIYTTVGSEYDATRDYDNTADARHATSVCRNAICQYVCECTSEVQTNARVNAHAGMCVIQ